MSQTSVTFRLILVRVMIASRQPKHTPDPLHSYHPFHSYIPLLERLLLDCFRSMTISPNIRWGIREYSHCFLACHFDNNIASLFHISNTPNLNTLTPTRHKDCDRGPYAHSTNLILQTFLPLKQHSNSSLMNSSSSNTQMNHSSTFLHISFFIKKEWFDISKSFILANSTSCGND
jgi:hypothetical protein